MALNLASTARARHPGRRVNIGICVSPAIAAAVDQSAALLGQSVSHLFRVAVTNYLLNQDSLPDELKTQVLISTQDVN